MVKIKRKKEIQIKDGMGKPCHVSGDFTAFRDRYQVIKKYPMSSVEFEEWSTK